MDALSDFSLVRVFAGSTCNLLGNALSRLFIIIIIIIIIKDSNRDLYWAHCGIFENVVLLMYTLEGVSSVANFITAYEEFQ